MKIYATERKRYDRKVKVSTDREEYFLDPSPSQKLVNHSPDGFEWGYGGSGPSQLALAILLDLTGEKDIALSNYMQFKFDMIANRPHTGFSISEDDIRSWLKEQREKTL